ncbi:MAG: hypothetical protein PHC32_06010 [Candidatus Izemoplasmatales bacterium]|nr:hypothetical protein [Candidatus Izemoplasmatales bacterium]
MKKLVKISLLFVIAFAIVNFVAVNKTKTNAQTSNPEVVLVDFEDSGDPEFVTS